MKQKSDPERITFIVAYLLGFALVCIASPWAALGVLVMLCAERMHNERILRLFLRLDELRHGDPRFQPDDGR